LVHQSFALRFLSVPLKLIGRIPFPDYRKFTEQQAKDMIAAVTTLLGAL